MLARNMLNYRPSRKGCRRRQKRDNSRRSQRVRAGVERRRWLMASKYNRRVLRKRNRRCMRSELAGQVTRTHRDRQFACLWLPTSARTG